MTDQALNQPGVPDEACGPLVRTTGPAPADIIELIMADHRRIRRLCQTLQDTARRPGDPDPGCVWRWLSGLLTAHFEAVEEICYLPVVKAIPEAGEQCRELTVDHDDIREAISEASLRVPGSASWWRAVRAAMSASAAHVEREESGVLADCLPRLEPRQRQILGRQWSAFRAARALDSVAWPRRSPDEESFS